MLKILETGLDPRNITALIYDHYDPDLCGSIPNLEEMIDNSDLRLISSGFSHMFIRHYGSKSKFVTTAELDYKFVFKTGRKLEFISIPYCHSRGSFVIFDHQSRILFSGDMFGTYEQNWQLFLGFPERCSEFASCGACPDDKASCRLGGHLDFHRKIMTSSKAVHYALDKLKNVPFELVASQHGSIIDRNSAEIIMRELENSHDIGIDRFLAEV